jgi:hypothetical protein
MCLLVVLVGVYDIKMESVGFGYGEDGGGTGIGLCEPWRLANGKRQMLSLSPCECTVCQKPFWIRLSVSS